MGVRRGGGGGGGDCDGGELACTDTFCSDGLRLAVGRGARRRRSAVTMKVYVVLYHGSLGGAYLQHRRP